GRARAGGGRRRIGARSPGLTVTAWAGTTIHASAGLVGARAVLIRGPAGCGKSRLALALIESAGRAGVRFARLVTDDRAELEPRHGRLLVRSPPAILGLIEARR